MLLTEFHLLHFFFSSWFLLFLSNYKWWDWFCKVSSSPYLYFFLVTWILLCPFPCHLATAHANCKGYLLCSTHICLPKTSYTLIYANYHSVRSIQQLVIAISQTVTSYYLPTYWRNIKTLTTYVFKDFDGASSLLLPDFSLFFFSRCFLSRTSQSPSCRLHQLFDKQLHFNYIMFSPNIPKSR